MVRPDGGCDEPSDEDLHGLQHNILIVFAGFVIGWLSATIARYVYPPPKKYRSGPGQAS